MYSFCTLFEVETSSVLFIYLKDRHISRIQWQFQMYIVCILWYCNYILQERLYEIDK